MPATGSVRRWCFTINNPTDDDDPMKWGVQYATWQKEEGADKTPHLQGYVELEKKSRLSAMKKLNGRAHWEQCKGTQKQNIDYCTKEEGRLDGPWEYGDKNQQGKRTDLEMAVETLTDSGLQACAAEHPVEYVKFNSGLEKLASTIRQSRLKEKEAEKYATVQLRDWQEELMGKLSDTPDDRKILWFYEQQGNTGKTWMARYLIHKRGATVLDCSKKSDLTYMLRGHTGDVVVFNITRSVDKEYWAGLYSLMESIKDDLVVSTKYETQRVQLGPQHVVVFANEEPDYSKWSDDRYDVTKIPTKRMVTHLGGVPMVPPLKRHRVCEHGAVADGFEPGAQCELCEK